MVPTSRQRAQSQRRQTYAQEQSQTPWAGQRWPQGNRQGGNQDWGHPQQRTQSRRRGKGKKSKSEGKSTQAQSNVMAPPPPPPISGPNATQVPWMTMPAAPGTTAQAEPPQDQKFTEVMQLLSKQDKETLTTDLQAFVQKEGAKAVQTTAKQLHSAVHDMTKAEKAMSAAVSSRTNLLASWRSFLTASLATWREYTDHFLKQEEQCRQEIAAAKESLAKAKVKAQEGFNRKTKSENADALVISDEEDQDQQAAQASTERILSGLQNMTASLEELAKKAEQDHAEAQRQVKRPRKEDDPDEAMPEVKHTEPSAGHGVVTPPFVQPGQK